MKIHTVGELREFIANLPDSTPLAQYENGMERHGFMPNAHINVRNMEKEEVQTYDAFDYTPYHYERLNPVSKDGTPYLVFE